MHNDRKVIQFVLGFILFALVVPASLSRAAQSTTYCIYGTGDGSSWDWEARFRSSTAVEIDRCVGTATAPMSSTASEIRDILVDQINAACGIVVTAVPIPSPGGTCLTHPAFVASGFFDFDLYLEEKANPGTLSLVGPMTPVEFNPFVFVDVPEPSSMLLLSFGVLGLVGLTRSRLSRTMIPPVED